MSAGGFVTGVTAVDPDLFSSQIAYSLSSQSSYFTIDPNNGVITALQTVSSSAFSTSVLSVVATKMVSFTAAIR
jgi:uncharacterized protein YjdB